ncbi:hypothetical protein F5Y10DRAFT_240382 [Nemania abortiva]|nr:hypothetical protein F5Y10DRAFT_240382 [Nemania abortiva]
MTDSNASQSSNVTEQPPPDSQQSGQAQNTVTEQTSSDNTPQAQQASPTEAQKEIIKDQVDGATPSGPPKTDQQSAGGRVIVGETGDLRDLAARRQSRYT